MQKGRKKESFNILKRINGAESAASELKLLKPQLQVRSPQAMRKCSQKK